MLGQAITFTLAFFLLYFLLQAGIAIVGAPIIIFLFVLMIR